jgi:hypothetical protein
LEPIRSSLAGWSPRFCIWLGIWSSIWFNFLFDFLKLTVPYNFENFVPQILVLVTGATFVAALQTALQTI